jgi:hypothetical protein
MILPELAERIANLPSGFLTDESRLDRPYLYSLIHTAAAQAKQISFQRTKRIESSWMFPYFPEFNEAAQIGDCYYKFKLPQIVPLDGRQTGLGYIGSIDCNTLYRTVENRAKFAAMQMHRIMKNRRNTVLIENGSIEIYGSAKEARIDGCWFDVTTLPNFNINKDDYPISANLIPEIERLILQIDLATIMKSRQDYKQNKMDDSGAATTPLTA